MCGVCNAGASSVPVFVFAVDFYVWKSIQKSKCLFRYNWSVSTLEFGFSVIRCIPIKSVLQLCLLNTLMRGAQASSRAGPPLEPSTGKVLHSSLAMIRHASLSARPIWPPPTHLSYCGRCRATADGNPSVPRLGVLPVRGLQFWAIIKRGGSGSLKYEFCLLVNSVSQEE